MIPVVGLMLTALLGGAVADSLRKHRRRGHRPAPRTIAEITDGYVRITGVVRALGEPMTSPIVGARCVYWRTRLLANRSADPLRIDDAVPFIVEDSTGDVIVRSIGAQTLTIFDETFPGYSAPKLTTSMQELLAVQLERFTHPYTHAEEITLNLGDTVDITGFVDSVARTTGTLQTADYREAPMQKRLSARGSVPMQMALVKR